MKFLVRISLVLLLLVFAGGIYLLMAFSIVRTDDGYHLIRKKDFKFSTKVVDTRDWSALDYLKNQEVGKEIAKIKWGKFKDKATEYWNDFSHSLEDFSKDYNIDKETDAVKRQFEKLRRDAKKRYEALSDKLKSGEIDFKQFNQKVEELRDWLTDEFEDIKSRFNNN